MWSPLKLIADRRNNSSFQVSLSTKLYSSSEIFEGTADSLSRTGVSVVLNTPQVFHTNNLYRVEINLPSDAYPVAAEGRIIKVRKHSDNACSLHIQFDSISEDDRDRIESMRRTTEKTADRRMESRLLSCISARIWVLGNAVPAFTKDISASGIRMQFSTACWFAQDEQYRIEIDLPRSTNTVHATGRVVRIDRQEIDSDERTVAFEFTDIEGSDRSLVRRFVERREMERKRLDLK